jgi:hypothetical protein
MDRGAQSRAFAYMQAYPANAWPQTHLTHLPNGAVVIDAFIGEPAMLWLPNHFPD